MSHSFSTRWWLTWRCCVCLLKPFPIPRETMCEIALLSPIPYQFFSIFSLSLWSLSLSLALTLSHLLPASLCPSLFRTGILVILTLFFSLPVLSLLLSFSNRLSCSLYPSLAHRNSCWVEWEDDFLFCEELMPGVLESTDTHTHTQTCSFSFTHSHTLPPLFDWPARSAP